MFEVTQERFLPDKVLYAAPSDFPVGRGEGRSPARPGSHDPHSRSRRRPLSTGLLYCPFRMNRGL